MYFEKGLSLSQFNGLPTPLLRQLAAFHSSTSRDDPRGPVSGDGGNTIQFKRIMTREPEDARGVSSGIYPNLSALT